MGFFDDTKKFLGNAFKGGQSFLGDAKDFFYDEPAARQQQALADAAERSHQLALEQRAFQMEGLGKAQEKYKPVHDAYDLLYGRPTSWSK